MPALMLFVDREAGPVAAGSLLVGSPRSVALVLGCAVTSHDSRVPFSFS
jgi:hypothetical protein